MNCLLVGLCAIQPNAFLLLLLPKLPAINGILFVSDIQVVNTKTASAYPIMKTLIDQYLRNIVELNLSLKD
jgi:hypothetical protein